MSRYKCICEGFFFNVLLSVIIAPQPTNFSVIIKTLVSELNLLSCPSLRTPPLEVVGRGFESVKAYLKRLHGGFTECRRTKLMFVGLGEAGKTR